MITFRCEDCRHIIILYTYVMDRMYVRTWINSWFHFITVLLSRCIRSRSTSFILTITKINHAGHFAAIERKQYGTVHAVHESLLLGIFEILSQQKSNRNDNDLNLLLAGEIPSFLQCISIMIGYYDTNSQCSVSCDHFHTIYAFQMNL